MSPLFSVLLGISLAGLLIRFIYQFFKTGNKRTLILQVLVLVLAGAFLYWLFWSKGQATPKGGDTGFVIVLYLFMALGMLAHAAYTRFEKPKSKRPPFDIGTFIAPLLASPIIFIPLLAALQNADVDLENLTAPRMMVFLVAFENGFFWKEYFDHRRKDKEKDGA